MKVCNFCSSIFKGDLAEDPSQCEICKGELSNIDSLLEPLKDLASKYNYNFETHISKDILIREEEYLESISIKSYLNQYIVSYLGPKREIYNPDITFILDFKNKKSFYRWNSIYIFGRYKKKPGISQSIWNTTSGEKYPSIERIIGEVAKEIYKAKDYSLHASGREDVDVENLAGRPFVLELKEAQVRSFIDFSGTYEGVEIYDLKLVPKRFVTIVSDSHFDKVYICKISSNEGISKEDLEKLRLSNILLHQRTPNRVAHRRADLVRKRIVYKVIPRDPNYLIIFAEAGTYIKEFVSGDKGRTAPSVSSILGKEVVCEELKVSFIDDFFLNTLSL